MIVGALSPERKGIVRIAIGPVAGTLTELPLVVDTGFAGAVALPRDVIARLGLAFIGTRTVRLAIGGHDDARLYRAQAVWDGRTRIVQVLETRGPTLVAVSLLYGYVLTFEAVDGGRVVIEKL